MITFPSLKSAALYLLAGTLLLLTPGRSGTCRAQDAEGAFPADLSPEEFLRRVREPLSRDAWGEATGRITHSGDGKETLRGDIRVRLTFSATSVYAQLVLNETNVYTYEQNHEKPEDIRTTLDVPEKEAEPGLFAFGVTPEDITFAFIYWNFRRELPRDDFRRRACRVLELEHPDGKGTVRVWFDASHGFPLKAEWYETNAAKTPWRLLELKGAKKHEGDLWFVKELRLESSDWKTQVRFDHAEINPVEATGIQPAP